jgi:tRNA pseudouridine55 synthase
VVGCLASVILQLGDACSAQHGLFGRWCCLLERGGDGMPTRLDGFLAVDKPDGITSRAALDRALAWFPRGTRMGHTGTLDPLATGVLVLCLGAATRLAEYIQRMSKVYRTTIRLGARSDTDDADGTVTPVDGVTEPDLATVEARLAGFVGEIEQVPPAFSAAKVAGRRAYDLARRGDDIILKPRRVRIDRIDVVRFAYPELELVVRCGMGTYIRSLARDLGNSLGCGALVQVLRRTVVGPFRVEQAVTLDADAATVHARLQPLQAAVSCMPSVFLTAQDARRLSQGRELVGVRAEYLDSDEPTEVAVFDEERLVAIGFHDPRQGWLRPHKVLG